MMMKLVYAHQCVDCERSAEDIYLVLCDDCKNLTCFECIDNSLDLNLCETCINERLIQEQEDLY